MVVLVLGHCINETTLIKNFVNHHVLVKTKRKAIKILNILIDSYNVF